MAVCPFNFIELCAGAGGLGLGIELAEPGARSIAFVEREAYAASTLVARMEAGDLASAPIWSDLGTFDARAWRSRVHCVTSGDPCQPNSVAGKRGGADDDRFLIEQVCRVVDECRPLRLFRENVTGNAAGQLEALVPALERMGYRVEVGIFGSGRTGNSHHRERLIVMADAEDGAGWLYQRPRQSAPRAADARGDGGELGDATGEGPFPASLGSAGGGVEGPRPRDAESERRSGPVEDAERHLEEGRQPAAGETESRRTHGQSRGSGRTLEDSAMRRRGAGREVGEGEVLRVQGQGWEALAGDGGSPLANTGDRQLPQPRREPQRRDGSRSAGADMADASDARSPCPRRESQSEGAVEQFVDGGGEAAVGVGLADPDCQRSQGIRPHAGAVGRQDARGSAGLCDGAGLASTLDHGTGRWQPAAIPGPGDPFWASIAFDAPHLLPAASRHDRFCVALRDAGLAPNGDPLAGSDMEREARLDEAGFHSLRAAIVQAAARACLRGRPDALAPRVDRLRLCGNGVDPITAAVAYLCLDARHRRLAAARAAAVKAA